MDRPAPDSPRLGSFLSVFALSVLMLSLWGAGNKVIGFLLIFWGFVSLLRVLWMYEGLREQGRNKGKKRSYLLPWIILDEMQRHALASKTGSALGAFSMPALLMFSSLLLYMLFSFFSAAAPEIPEAQQKINEIIMERFDIGYNPGIVKPFVNFGIFLVFVLAFFTTQTYAFASDRSSAWLWFLLLPCFAFGFSSIVVLDVQIPQDFKSYHLFLYFAGFVPATVFVRNLGRQACRLHVILGLLVLLLMILNHLFVSEPPPVLWFCSWLSLAVLWALVDVRREKEYRIHQV